MKKATAAQQCNRQGPSVVPWSLRQLAGAVVCHLLLKGGEKP